MDFFNSVAAFSYSGANFLQWPHLHNIKTLISAWHLSPLPWCIEFDQDDIVLRYTALEVTLVKLQHVAVCKDQDSERC